MSEQILDAEEINTELLKEIFEQAFADTEIDGDGDLFVRIDGLGCWVLAPDQNRIRLLSFITQHDEATDSQKLDFVNRFNTTYIMVRSSLLDNGRIAFDYDVITQYGGVTRKSLYQLTRRFLSIMREGVSNLDHHGIFK